jgi:hypothetical protein
MESYRVGGRSSAYSHHLVLDRFFHKPEGTLESEKKNSSSRCGEASLRPHCFDIETTHSTPLTKARYHTKLHTLLPDLAIPRAEEESADLGHADRRKTHRVNSGAANRISRNRQFYELP